MYANLNSFLLLFVSLQINKLIIIFMFELHFNVLLVSFQVNSLMILVMIVGNIEVPLFIYLDTLMIYI